MPQTTDTTTTTIDTASASPRRPRFDVDLLSFLAEPPASTLTRETFKASMPLWSCQECGLPPVIEHPQSFTEFFSVDEELWTSLRRHVVRVAIEYLGWGCWDFIRH